MSAGHFKYSWTSACRTHVGKVRQVNEDAFLDRADQGLWVVADGMGGHSAGDYASSSIVGELQLMGPATGLKEFVSDLVSRLQEVNARLRQEARKNGQVIGSTVVGMQLYAGYCAYSWVGDSRIYRLRGKRLEQLTEDHTLVEEMVQQGLLAREAAASHPSSNVITRAVGAEDRVKIDTDYTPLRDDDLFLLCSDGLCKELDDLEIQAILNSNSLLEEMADQLMSQALENGGRDNITFCLTRVTGIE